jgi:hypothetical protein
MNEVFRGAGRNWMIKIETPMDALAWCLEIKIPTLNYLLLLIGKGGIVV